MHHRVAVIVLRGGKWRICSEQWEESSVIIGSQQEWIRCHSDSRLKGKIPAGRPGKNTSGDNVNFEVRKYSQPIKEGI
jgi:hypothetical protein